MSTATLNGIVCTSVTVNLPSWGLWWADVETDGETSFTGSVALHLADLALSGTIVSGSARMGRGSWRIVGGAGGWSKSLPAKGYTNDAGIKLAKVLGDAATECGEAIETAPPTVIGAAFARPTGAASTVLQLLVPQGWYVGEDGVTRLGKRVGAVVQGAVTRGRVDASAGSIELMADSIASILPGCICDGMIAVDVVHVLSGNRLRSTLYGSAFGAVSKRLLAWSRLLEQLRPFDRYRGVWEYRVVAQNSDRLDLQAASTRFGLPDLRGVRVRAGIPGVRAENTIGSLVLVAFVNCDPTRPCVVGFDEYQSASAPKELHLVGEDDSGIADPTGRVVRYGDIVALPIGPPPSPGAIPPSQEFQLMPGVALVPGVFAASSVSRVRA